MAIFHSYWFCARSWSISRDLESLSINWFQVFGGLSFLCCPSTIISQHIFITLLSLHLSTWPNHFNLYLLIQFLMLSRPSVLSVLKLGFLSFKVALHTIIIINPVLIWFYPSKWGWPDLPHSASNLSHQHK